jgi:hypothetical protein
LRFVCWFLPLLDLDRDDAHCRASRWFS